MLIKKMDILDKKNQQHPSNKEKGQVLVEAAIALSIIAVGVLGVLGLVYRAISLNRVVSDQLTGAYLAAEGIEITKNLIDANVLQNKAWNDGFSDGSYEADYSTLLSASQNPGTKIGGVDTPSPHPLKFDPVSGFYRYDPGNPTNFFRTIIIERIGSDEMRVNSVVRWTTRGGGNFSVNAEDHFFNWRPVP